jgi:hypothetical protein
LGGFRVLQGLGGGGGDGEGDGRGRLVKGAPVGSREEGVRGVIRGEGGDAAIEEHGGGGDGGGPCGGPTRERHHGGAQADGRRARDAERCVAAKRGSAPAPCEFPACPEQGPGHGLVVASLVFVSASPAQFPSHGGQEPPPGRLECRCGCLDLCPRAALLDSCCKNCMPFSTLGSRVQIPSVVMPLIAP